MRKHSLFVLMILATITACKPFTADIEAYLSYWSSEAAIVKAEIIPYHPSDKDGIASVASENEVSIRLTVRNPKNYRFLVPTPSLSTPVVVFQDGIVSSTAVSAPPPQWVSQAGSYGWNGLSADTGFRVQPDFNLYKGFFAGV